MRLGRRYWDWNQRVAQHHLASRRAHPNRWVFIEFGAGAAAVAVLWVTWGHTVAIAFAISWGSLMLLGLLVLWARSVLARRDRLSKRSDPPAEM